MRKVKKSVFCAAEGGQVAASAEFFCYINAQCANISPFGAGNAQVGFGLFGAKREQCQFFNENSARRYGKILSAPRQVIGALSIDMDSGIFWGDL